MQRVQTEAGSLMVLVDILNKVENSNFPGQSWHRIWFFPNELTIRSDSEMFIMPRRTTQPETAPPEHRSDGIFQEGKPPPDMVQKIVRYTSVFKALGFTGSNFSTKLADKNFSEEEQRAWVAKQEMIFATMSQPLPENKWFDYFISYRWKMGRLFTTLSLMVHLNHLKAAVVTFASTFVIQVVASLVEHYYGVAILPHAARTATGHGRVGTSSDPWYFSIWS